VCEKRSYKSTKLFRIFICPRSVNSKPPLPISKQIRSAVAADLLGSGTYGFTVEIACMADLCGKGETGSDGVPTRYRQPQAFTVERRHVKRGEDVSFVRIEPGVV